MTQTAQRRLLKALNTGAVDFILIGGHAVSAHGYERATRDVDIVYSTGRGNCERLASVLAELGAEVVLADGHASRDRVEAEELVRGGHFRFATEAGPLDALSSVSGFDFERLGESALALDLGDLKLRVCSLADLLELKADTGRPRDREDVRQLTDLRPED